jgi:hypothetical protein
MYTCIDHANNKGIKGYIFFEDTEEGLLLHLVSAQPPERRNLSLVQKNPGLFTVTIFNKLLDTGYTLD